MFPTLRPPPDNFRCRGLKRHCAPRRSCGPGDSPRADLCPAAPTSRQDQFLGLNVLEAFYGGAAGGGKSTALLMDALRHVHVPGYAALIVRRDLPRLSLPGGLIPRSHEWLRGSHATYSARRCQWTFPTGGVPATITFGYLHSPLDKFRYGSSEYQFIAFDELTEFAEDDYLFLFSRLRRTSGLSAPLRVRSASNPGGPGHLWVKHRFVDLESHVAAAGSEEAAATRDRSIFVCGNRGYVPARIDDNPHLLGDEYRQSLLHLPPVARQRLLAGDWSIQEAGVFRQAWLRYYLEVVDELHVLDPRGNVVAAARDDRRQYFCTIDPAGTPAEVAQAKSSGRHSFSVIQVWFQPHGKLARFLFLRHQWREQVDFAELLHAIRRINKQFRPLQIYIEKERLGTALCGSLADEGVPIVAIPPEGKEKQQRAGPLIARFERGEVLLPKLDIAWLPDFQTELLAWTGAKREPCDQIDAAAYAAIIALRSAPQPELVLEPLGM
jgi:predicted phage terminase large subunit-like protein